MQKNRHWISKWIGLFILFHSVFVFAANPENKAIIYLQSPYSVETTVNKITQNLQAKGVKIFARINFSADAKAVGLYLPDETLLIFGNPKAGTFLLQENPMIGLELPLKILVWRNASGQTEMAYRDPSMLAKQYAITQSRNVIANMKNLLTSVLQIEP